MLTLPTDMIFVLNDADWDAGWWPLRLSRPPAPDLPDTCVLCGGASTWDHCFVCPDLLRRSLDHRHGLVGRAFERMGDAAGCVLKWDPSPTTGEGSRDRPDFRGWLPDGTPLTADVEGGHPAADTYVGLAARRNGYVCEQESRNKRAKYAHIVQQRGGLFFGLSFETFGRTSRDTRAFLSLMARWAARRCGRSWAERTFAARFRADLQLAIVRGNAAVAREFVLRTRAVQAAYMPPPRRMLSTPRRRGPPRGSRSGGLGGAPPPPPPTPRLPPRQPPRPPPSPPLPGLPWPTVTAGGNQHSTPSQPPTAPPDANNDDDDDDEDNVNPQQAPLSCAPAHPAAAPIHAVERPHSCSYLGGPNPDTNQSTDTSNNQDIHTGMPQAIYEHPQGTFAAAMPTHPTPPPAPPTPAHTPRPRPPRHPPPHPARPLPPPPPQHLNPQPRDPPTHWHLRQPPVNTPRPRPPRHPPTHSAPPPAADTPTLIPAPFAPGVAAAPRALAAIAADGPRSARPTPIRLPDGLRPSIGGGSRGTTRTPAQGRARRGGSRRTARTPALGNGARGRDRAEGASRGGYR